MENASKALIIAGGILTAILVIGAVLLMVNNIGAYQDTQNSNEKNSQISKFNMDFERYLDDKGISGADIVTLCNKILDFNSKQGTTAEASNSIDYTIKMSLTVDMTGFSKKYAYGNNGIFSANEYKVNTNNSGNLVTIIKQYNPIFNGNDKKLITSLVDIYDKDNQKNIQNLKKILEEKKGSKYNNWDGSNLWPTLGDIEHYKEYTEFKTSTFEVSKEAEYKNGQIQQLFFKWKK